MSYESAMFSTHHYIWIILMFYFLWWYMEMCMITACQNGIKILIENDVVKMFTNSAKKILTYTTL